VQSEKTSTTPYGDHGGCPGCGFRGSPFFVSKMFRLILTPRSKPPRSCERCSERRSPGILRLGVPDRL
jgi:hypothetical protein